MSWSTNETISGAIWEQTQTPKQGAIVTSSTSSTSSSSWSHKSFSSFCYFPLYCLIILSKPTASNMRTSVKQWTLAFSKLVLHITIPRHHIIIFQKSLHIALSPIVATNWHLLQAPCAICFPDCLKDNPPQSHIFIVNPSGSQYCKHLEKVVDNHQF